ncbi:MAG TPA: tyrosine--tRNA ligase [Phycisphaerae bacterium]|nr:tyrosine--tRNA ligase [Phycisphaerae bacterium]HOI53849.1 tyrosine--tRNA ligase [Phycisphaerae bacterium]
MSELPEEIRRRVERDLEALKRGAVEIYSCEELGVRLGESYQTGRPLRVKLGMDPTAPDIHLGHTVVLRKMRQFQDLGHKAVLIIGDYTARVGDPSGQNKTRPVLSPEAIDAHAETYLAQAGKVLDLAPEKLEVRRNSEWLAKLSFADVIRLTSKMTVARMLERDTFALRHKSGDPIGIHEFLYPLMQGYDSMMIEADVELGGTDQTFNNLVGRDLQRDAGQKPQIVMIMPILVGLDGVQKMSKSKGNYIGVTDAPADMYGKAMSIPDELMGNYYELLTSVSADERRELTGGKVHPREAKARLARTIVEQFHGPEAAAAAAAEFDRVFAQKEQPTEMPEVTVGAGELGEGGIWIARLIGLCGFARSNGEAMRLVQQGGVTLDEQTIADPKGNVTFADGAVLKVGKRRFARLRVR